MKRRSFFRINIDSRDESFVCNSCSIVSRRGVFGFDAVNVDAIDVVVVVDVGVIFGVVVAVDVGV